jgi:TonB-linked SusC/RagA family outer membrane protein
MKKIINYYWLSRPISNWQKLLRNMKLTVFLLFFGLIGLIAGPAYSQNTKITLDMKNAPISSVLNHIEEISEFYFLYNSKLIDVEKKVDIVAKEEPIRDILTEILPTNVTFIVSDKQIVLSPVRDLSANSILQQSLITGTVTASSTGEPMPGVNVQVKGTLVGAISDANGRFIIPSEIDQNATLVFSFIGYISQEIPVAGRNVIDVVMVEELTGLNEVVVVGYTSQVRKSLTGAISTVNGTSLADETSSNAITRLQGKATGVNIINSHTPGGDAIVNIRGMGTINNNTPLYVIDGVPTKSGVSQVNPNEIESITILKDATSAAIYGARGANGVIIITTKRGSPGETKVSFTARYGVNSIPKYYDLLNTQEYGELLWLEANNQGKTPSSILYGSGLTPVIPDYVVPAGRMEGDPLVDPTLYNYTPGSSFYNITKANKEGTDWYKEIFQRSPVQEYNLALSGGGEKGAYAFNLGYSTEDGILKYTSFDRYSIRSNADSRITKWLKVGESIGLTYSNVKGLVTDNSETSGISYGYRMQPIIPVYDIQGNFAGTKGNGTGNGDNPVAVLYRNRDDYGKNLRGIGNAYAEVQIVKGLNFKSLFGFDYITYNGKNLTRQNPEYQEATTTDAVSMSHNNTLQWNWANTLNFSKVFADLHTLNILVGSEAVSSMYNYTSAARSSYFSDDVDYMYLDGGQGNQTNSGSSSETITASYFGRLNYDFKGKYLLEATFRRDGSSRFGANYRWGNFPAVSVGWRISEEGFMEGTKDIIDNLKVRGGYGISGNDEIGNYNSYAIYSSHINYSYYGIVGNPNSSTAGFYASRIGNPNAKWETTSTMNIGLDIAVLKNTLSATFDVWQRKTNDMLFPVAIPYVSGNATAPSVNIGDMNNKGFDLSINYANNALSRDLTFDFGLTLSHYKNEVIKISDNEEEFINGGDYRQMFYTRATKGTAFPEFYGLIVDGIFQTQAEADEHPKEYGTYNMPGHFKYRDINNDGVVNDNDRTYIGSPHPKFTAGLNMNIGYKAFNISAFLYSSYGNKIANYVKRWIDYTQFTGNRTTDRLYKSWGSPYLDNNEDAVLPLADEVITSQYPSTAFLEDGSFLRLKTLQLSYSLPANISQRLTLKYNTTRNSDHWLS